MKKTRRETWERKRARHQHFTAEEIEFVGRSFLEGIRPYLVAQKLQCSERVIQARYAALSGSQHKRTGSAPKPQGQLRASRFYKSDFEIH